MLCPNPRWCEPIEAPVLVGSGSSDPPFFDNLAHLLERVEQVLVKTIAMEAPIEALGKAILTYDWQLCAA